MPEPDPVSADANTAAESAVSEVNEAELPNLANTAPVLPSTPPTPPVPPPVTIVESIANGDIEVEPSAELDGETPVLAYEILERQGTTLQVKFSNPHWIGEFVDEEYVEMVDEKSVTTIRSVDKDPNQSITKTVNVPLLTDGAADRGALKRVIFDQARGVKSRMDATMLQNAAPHEEDLDALIGANL